MKRTHLRDGGIDYEREREIEMRGSALQRYGDRVGCIQKRYGCGERFTQKER